MDVYGVPFQLLPFANASGANAIEPPKTTHVHTRRDRDELRLDFPRVNQIFPDVGDTLVVAWDEEFLERAEGGGQIGGLDAPSFVATVSGWVIASYLRAFEAVEWELEELDAKVISQTPRRDVSGDLSRLVELRRRIGLLRRALSPHREVVVSLAHPELDKLSTEDSARRFAELEQRVTQALDAARETKESTFGSFDLLVARIGQRTNDIMKLLTLVTVILLPATVIAGVMGMNFKVALFGHAWLFWASIATMLLIAVLVLAAARVREWI